MTLEEPIASTKLAPDRDAVEYATITIKVPVDRIGNVFRCVRYLYSNDKRLSRVSYRKQVKVDYTKRTGAAPSSDESSSESVSEISETNTEISRSSIKETIKEMVSNEVKKVLSTNDYKRVVATSKPEPKSRYVIPVTIQSQYDMCECLGFKHEYEERRLKKKSHESDLMILANIIGDGRYSTRAALNRPCNIEYDETTRILKGTRQCYAVAKREDSEKQTIVKVEEESVEPGVDWRTGFPKLSKLEDERKDRTHKSYVATMKTSIPLREEVEQCRKIWHKEVNIYGKGHDYVREHSLRFYRINGKFYNAWEFNDLYNGMGWFRKKNWNKYHN